LSKLSIKNLHKQLGDNAILNGISLDIQEREFVCFLGPSGCGKSTLLRTIAGLESIDQGEIYIQGRCVNEVEPAQRDLAMVFQSYALYPHMNVRKNMSFGLSLRKFKKAEIEQRINEAARMLQLEHLLERKPKQLSGGQRQRVAIGRAIVRQPQIFLFDEPLSNLDAELRVNTRMEIAKLHKQLNATMIYVTHDQVEAMTLADKVVVMNAGKIEQVGAPLQLYHQPRNRFVAGFIGSPKMNFMDAKISAHNEHGKLQIEVNGHSINSVFDAKQTELVDIGSPICLGIRPEHVCISPSKDSDANTGMPAQIIMVERLGSENLAYLDLANGNKLTMSLDGNNGLKRGDVVHVQFDLEHMHLFNQQGLALQRPLSSSVQNLL
jgi:multiple sugar transport system ATP-binding protein